MIALQNLTNFCALGGCHCSGYPFKKPLGFAYIATKKINPNFSGQLNNVLLNLNHIEKAIKIYKELQPDVLILQLGHFETSKTLLPRFLNTIMSPNINIETETYNSTPSSIFSSRKVYVKIKILNFIKFIYYIIFKLKYDSNQEINYKLSNFLNEINKVKENKNISILLSPFPCFDLVTNYRRKRLLPMYEEYAKNYGLIYINVFEALKDKNIFFDSIHLNEKGHSIVGQLVADSVSAEVSRRNLKENF